MARHLGVDVVTSGVLEPSEDDISTSELPSFDMSLAPVGDEGSSFRTRNDPSAPFQRSNYVERKGQSISGAPVWMSSMGFSPRMAKHLQL